VAQNSVMQERATDGNQMHTIPEGNRAWTTWFFDLSRTRYQGFDATGIINKPFLFTLLILSYQFMSLLSPLQCVNLFQFNRLITVCWNLWSSIQLIG
jgi:hypothetical protein